MGRWWNNPQMIQRLGVTPDQKRKMDEIFQQHRLKLIDLNAALQKAEVSLEPLLGAEQPDEGKILAQIESQKANIESAEASLDRLKISLEDSNNKLRRARDLHRRKLVTTPDLETAEVENLPLEHPDAGQLERGMLTGLNQLQFGRVRREFLEFNVFVQGADGVAGSS